MKKNPILPEIFISSQSTSKDIAQMIRSGMARKVAPRLYTTNMMDSLESIVKRNLWPIIALLAPGSVVSYRTAFENRPADDGSVFLTGSYTRNIELPGITIRQIQGTGSLPNDMPYMTSLHLASRPRSFLENLSPSRQREKVAKTVGISEVERRLVDILRVNGEKELNRLRDEARRLAPTLEMTEQFHTLDQLIGALLRSHQSELTSPAARAYAAGEPYDSAGEPYDSAGEPYDSARLPVFSALFAALRSGVWPSRPDKNAETHAFHNTAFFDAYFSNYIEGTDFPVEQAIRIVFNGEIPANRPADAHDVLGTYRLVASRAEMQYCPANFDEFLQILKHRHQVMMEARPQQMPGLFKIQNNQAGATMFVNWDLVIGTLRQGFLMFQALESPFERALFIMFLISEVHPFTDRNGRMARVMMNAELVAAGQTRIFIPSVYRNEYINSLKRLTNYQDPTAFIRVMSYAQLFVHRIDFAHLDQARQVLESHNAFHDATDDVKLQMPDEESF